MLCISALGNKEEAIGLGQKLDTNQTLGSRSRAIFSSASGKRSCVDYTYSLRPVLFAHLELSVKTKAAAKMTLLPLYKSDCAEAEGILRIDWKHRLLF